MTRAELISRHVNGQTSRQSASGLKAAMEDLLARELRRRAAEADLVVFTLYDPAQPDDPIDYQLEDAADGPIDLDVAFDFEGVGLWYLCYRDGNAFSARKILVQIRDGRFVHGQMGEFDGFWDEFPQYVAEDRWVRSALLRSPANEQR